MTSAQKQNRIYNTIMNVFGLPKVSVVPILNRDIFEIRHENVFVPNVRAEWCETKEHYRIYLLIAGSSYNKRNAGYCVCTIGSGMDAAQFATIYAFFHKRRANNKEESFA